MTEVAEPSIARPVPSDIRHWFESRVLPGGGARVLFQERLRGILQRIPALGDAEMLVESEQDRWLVVDPDPVEPTERLRTVVYLGNAAARDALRLLGRAYRWLEPGGSLLLLDYFVDAHTQPGWGTSLALENLCALAERSGFVLEPIEELALPWDRPAGHPEDVPLRGWGLTLRRAETPRRWRVSYQEPVLADELRSLFRLVFGHGISEALWRWKYDSGRGQGALALRGEKVVAHYGALTRRIRFLGRDEFAAQVVDVMVDPSDRGVLTRKGVFYQAAASIQECCMGYGSSHLIGYGFPNRRHNRLAERQGLYAEVETITELRWPATEIVGGGPLVEHLPSASDSRISRLVNDLWRRMARDLRDHIVGVRDFSWVRYRYLEHPEVAYRVLLVRGRWLRRPLGVAVVRVHDDQRVELMDVIGPLSFMAEVVRGVRDVAAKWDCKKVFCWITSEQASYLGSIGAEKADPDICIPTNIHTRGLAPDSLRGRWWLMSGDTDFR